MMYVSVSLNSDDTYKKMDFLSSVASEMVDDPCLRYVDVEYDGVVYDFNENLEPNFYPLSRAIGIAVESHDVFAFDVELRFYIADIGKPERRIHPIAIYVPDICRVVDSIVYFCSGFVNGFRCGMRPFAVSMKSISLPET